MVTSKIIAHTKECESCRLKIYNDSLGYPTIGWGHKLKDGENFPDGITQSKADNIFLADLCSAYLDAQKLVPNIDEFSEPRQAVVIDMSFNMGLYKFSGFHNLFAALRDKDWARAADEMKNSKWYDQVKTRAVKNCNMMISGEW